MDMQHLSGRVSELNTSYIGAHRPIDIPNGLGWAMEVVP